MATGPGYRVAFRRKREGRTDYRKRLNILMSKRPRTVLRFSNKHVKAQLVKYSPSGDRVIASTHSNELKKYGWKANTNNMPASYLTGFLLGKKTKEKGYESAVLDLGLLSPIRGSKSYSALKGLIDAGLKIPHNEEFLPEKSRIRGEHISGFKDMPEHFEKTLKSIRGA